MTTAAPPENWLLPPTEIKIEVRGKSHLTVHDVQALLVSKLKSLSPLVYVGEITVACVQRGDGLANVPDKKFIICPSSQ
jgi:hypothetical protein